MIVLSGLALLAPSLCLAQEPEVKAIFLTDNSTPASLLVVPPFGTTYKAFSFGPRKLFQELKLYVTSASKYFPESLGHTTTTFTLVPGEKVIAKVEYASRPDLLTKEVTVSRHDEIYGVTSTDAYSVTSDTSNVSSFSPETRNPHVVLGMSNNRILYAPVSDVSNISYFDGSTKSLHYLERQVFGPEYKNPIDDKNYDIYARRPKNKFVNCKTDFKCFEKAAKKCSFATYDHIVSLSEIFTGKRDPTEQTSTDHYEIWGKAGKDSCLYYRYALGNKDITSPDRLIQGLDGLCTKKPTDFLLPFINAQRGIFQFDSTAATKDCFGPYYLTQSIGY